MNNLGALTQILTTNMIGGNKMCNFFSCISDGKGKIWYFDYEIRKKIIEGKLDYYTDSHASIASFFNLNEDKLNKYE